MNKNDFGELPNPPPGTLEYQSKQLNAALIDLFNEICKTLRIDDLLGWLVKAIDKIYISRKELP